MQPISHITPDFAVTGALKPEDFRIAAAMGFRAIINNRPDDEEAGQLTGADEARLAAEYGLDYRFIPAGKLDLFTERVVEATHAALADLPGPVLAHCKAGMRSAIAWAAAASQMMPVEDVLAKVTAAGFDFDFLRDDFEALALPTAEVGRAAQVGSAGGPILTAAA